MTQESQGRPSKNERRQLAREQAKAAREAQRKKEKRNRFFLQGGIVIGVVAVIAIVGLVIANAVKPAGPGPANMASGGVVFGPDLVVQETEALPAEAKLVPTTVTRGAEDPLDIVVYFDYMCVWCGQFEQTNNATLENWVGSGQATLEAYPMNSLDAASLGTKYSTRAANALACVANYQPEAAWKLHTTLLSAEVQPEEATAGLTDKELLTQIEKAGGTVNGEMRSCVNDREFGKFIDQNAKRILAEPPANQAEGQNLPSVSGTPTVLVNGVLVDSALLYDEGQFSKYLEKALSDSQGTSSGSATPTPSEAPTETSKP
ncbi:DsbA family protein [Leucobacter sp. M11]|uniref:DsbA family protein n=1 Tax=Leucobacter sp. M11 TaxID=2993565 RepID=UPI002D7E9D29|nr:thioredoxin domain-containing protein [Leucobacter sp. M11]MEB4615459.1 thioredoxin domain-containing protein [Leucobacter sp. M11]